MIGKVKMTFLYILYIVVAGVLGFRIFGLEVAIFGVAIGFVFGATQGLFNNNT